MGLVSLVRAHGGRHGPHQTQTTDPILGQKQSSSFSVQILSKFDKSVLCTAVLLLPGCQPEQEPYNIQDYSNPANTGNV